MNEKEIINFVADVLRSEQYCTFNTMRTQGKHRQCDNYAREKVGGYGFCSQHAKVVREAAVNSVDSKKEETPCG